MAVPDRLPGRAGAAGGHPLPGGGDPAVPAGEPARPRAAHRPDRPDQPADRLFPAVAGHPHPQVGQPHLRWQRRAGRQHPRLRHPRRAGAAGAQGDRAARRQTAARRQGAGRHGRDACDGPPSAQPPACRQHQPASASAPARPPAAPRPAPPGSPTPGSPTPGSPTPGSPTPGGPRPAARPHGGRVPAAALGAGSPGSSAPAPPPGPRATPNAMPRRRPRWQAYGARPSGTGWPAPPATPRPTTGGRPSGTGWPGGRRSARPAVVRGCVVDGEYGLAAQVPADVGAPDRVLYGLTARQVAILAATGALLWVAYRTLTPLVSPVVVGIAAVPVVAVAAGLALGRRDGISMDRWVAAALAATRAPRLLVAATGTPPTAPHWAPAPRRLTLRAPAGSRPSPAAAAGGWERRTARPHQCRGWRRCGCPPTGSPPPGWSTWTRVGSR